MLSFFKSLKTDQGTKDIGPNKVISAHRDTIWDLFVIKESGLLITCSEDCKIKIWDLKTYQLVSKLRTNVAIYSIAYHIGKKIFFAGLANGKIEVYDIKGLSIIDNISAHSDIVARVRFSHNTKYIASLAIDGVIKIWNPDKFELYRTFQIKMRERGTFPLEFSADDQLVITTSFDCSILAFNISENKIQWDIKFAHEKPLFGLALSDKNALMVTSSRDSSIKIWDINSLKPLRTLPNAHEGRIHRVCLTPDDQFIVSASEDRKIKIWETATGALIRVLTCNNRESIFSLYLTSDVQFIISGQSNGKVEIFEFPWDLRQKCFDKLMQSSKSENPSLEVKKSIGNNDRQYNKDVIDDFIRSDNEYQTEKIKILQEQVAFLDSEIQTSYQTIDRLKQRCVELENQSGMSPDILNALEIEKEQWKNAYHELKSKESQMNKSQEFKSTKDCTFSLVKIPNPQSNMVEFLGLTLDKELLKNLGDEQKFNLFDVSYRKLFSHYILLNWQQIKPENYDQSPIEFVTQFEGQNLFDETVFFKAISKHYMIEIYLIKQDQVGITSRTINLGENMSKRLFLLCDIRNDKKPMWELLIATREGTGIKIFDAKDKFARDKAMLTALEREETIEPP